MHKLVDLTLRQAKRVVVIVVGFTVLLIGIVMIVAPGPALVVIPLGLAILATELAWARKLLRRVRDKAVETRNRFRGKPSVPPRPE